ncbi:MAG: hypothetical protein K2R98_21890 [Gemmataceae bacterium]|nr:hypothetical protein [Gemmataceae bacterium]
MHRTIQIETTVLPGNRIEIHVPELPEGRRTTVFVQMDEARTAKRPLSEVLKNYPGGLFRSAEEVDAYLRAERDSWDR